MIQVYVGEGPPRPVVDEQETQGRHDIADGQVDHEAVVGRGALLQEARCYQEYQVE